MKKCTIPEDLHISNADNSTAQKGHQIDQSEHSQGGQVESNRVHSEQFNQGVPERGSFGRGHAVALGVQVAAHLHGVAGLPLLDVLVHGGLQQVGVLALGLAHARHALVGALDEHRGVGALHEGPHLLEHSDLGPLCAQGEREGLC